MKHLLRDMDTALAQKKKVRLVQFSGSGSLKA